MKIKLLCVLAFIASFSLANTLGKRPYCQGSGDRYLTSYCSDLADLWYLTR